MERSTFTLLLDVHMVSEVTFLDLVPLKQTHGLSHIHIHLGLKILYIILEKKTELDRKWFLAKHIQFCISIAKALVTQ